MVSLRGSSGSDPLRPAAKPGALPDGFVARDIRPLVRLNVSIVDFEGGSQSLDALLGRFADLDDGLDRAVTTTDLVARWWVSTALATTLLVLAPRDRLRRLVGPGAQDRRAQPVAAVLCRAALRRRDQDGSGDTPRPQRRELGGRHAPDEAAIRRLTCIAGSSSG